MPDSEFSTPITMGDLQRDQLPVECCEVASDQRRKGRKSMSRRSGQRGHVVKKGNAWHVRFFVDLPGQDARKKKSVLVGPCTGPNKLTKTEAQRKAAEVITSLGVNTEEHLERAINPVTFKQRVEWCRENKSAWTEGKPSSILSMENQLAKHILPRFGDWPLHMVDETHVQEFISHLKRTTFEMKKPNGGLIKTYKTEPQDDFKHRRCGEVGSWQEGVGNVGVGFREAAKATATLFHR